MVTRNPIKSTVKVNRYTAPELQSHHKIGSNVGGNDTVYLDFFLSLSVNGVELKPLQSALYTVNDSQGLGCCEWQS